MGITLMPEITCSIEILRHFLCSSCNKWWSIADITFNKESEVTCPHCGTKHVITKIQNGKQEEVSGVAWTYPPEKGKPLFYELEGE